MTNEQLAVLLEGYRRRLQDAYDKIASIRAEKDECKDCLKDCFLFPSLDPLYQVIEALENDIFALTSR